MIKKGRKTQEEPTYTGPCVSELLKTTRERTSENLQTVAQVLRIRLVYLEAIEEGRYEDLPGRTYVVGFVRAYAEHIGLDSEEVVKRFKDEISGIEGKAELVFPSPVTEQSIPGGAIILIGMIILGAAYGGWYFLSSQDRSMAELVPDLPAKFAEMIDKVKGSKQDNAEPEVAEPVVEAAPEPAPDLVGEADTQDMAQVAREAVEQAEEKAEEVVQTVETVKVEDVVEEEIQEVVSSVEEKTPEPIVEEKKEEIIEKVEEVVEEATEAVEENVTETVQTTKAIVEEVTPEPEPAKPQPMTEKIVLKSVDYAWIQVTDAQGNVVHTQVLNENEEYEIPATQGLILRTGNAGGLEIFVDGEKMPSIGEAGEVLRKVFLNPTKLKAGRAVES